MRKYAVVLSGCGVQDGSEIGEAMCLLLALEEAGCVYEMFAPDKMQLRVMNHLKGEPMGEERNVLVEAARIARGKVKPLEDYRAEDFYGLLFPGGFGAATNLCTFAVKGAEMEVDAQVKAAVEATVKAGRQIGALCIAPVILGKLLAGVKLTVGHDASTGETLRKMGAEPVEVFGPEVVVDTRYKAYTSPCYMLPGATLATVAECCRNMVKELLKA